MQSLLHANLTTLELTESLDGGAVTLPRIVAGSDLSLKLRPTVRVGTTTVESTRTVSALKASLGLPDARPLSGQFRLHLGAEDPVEGENVTALLEHNATDTQLAAAINALTELGDALPCVVTKADDTWEIVFADGLQLDIACTENTLKPAAFVNAGAFQVDDTWHHTLRLVQTPVAQTATFGLIVPEAPTVSAIQNGGSEGDVEWNEVQKLRIPAEFRGAFQLKRGFTRTQPIGLPTSADEIAERLAEVADEDGEFSVTEQQDALLIEFKGSMGGLNQDLIEVVVFDAPAGDPGFTLRTGTAEMFALLDRLADARTNEVRLQLEITLSMPDEADEEVLRDYRFRSELVIVEPINTEARNVAETLNWNQPPARRRYIPFSPDQIATGHRQYSASIGDGVASDFVIDHNLNTDKLHVTVRENTAGGVRIQDDDYSVEFTDSNSLTLSFGFVPSANSLLVLITSAAQEANFQAHTHPIGEITGLEAIIADLGSRVETLEDQAGITELSSAAEPGTSGIVAQWTLPSFRTLYAVRDQPSVPSSGSGSAPSLSSFTPDVLAKAQRSGLLPAVHDATAEALPWPLPEDDEEIAGMAGKVYQNQTGAAVELEGGLGRRGLLLKDGEHAAVLIHDDRVSWYRVAKVHPDSTEKTFYPTDFERELFFIAVAESQLRVKKQLEVKLGIEVGLFGENTKCQWVVRIEHGAYTQETSPATTGRNLKAIAWNAVPILEQPLIVTPVPHIAALGCRIIRSSAETFAAKKIAYGDVSAAGSAPSSANFLLRARLCCFDTEDNQPDPRGLIAAAGCNVTFNEEDADAALGLAIIKSA